jgi:predicted nucleotidyltransferase
MPITEEKMKTLPEIERILRDQKPILREKFKVREIGIFGSVVRGEQKETSDLDLLVEFEEPIGLIKYVNLQNYLSDKIESRVDLVMKSGLKPRISRHVLKEVIYV